MISGERPAMPAGDEPVSASSSRPPQRKLGRSLGRSLPVAIASGVALAVLFGATLLLADLAFLSFVAVLVALGLLELDAAFRTRGLRPATPVVLAAGLLMLYGAYAGGPQVQTLGLVVLLIGAVAWAVLDPRNPRIAGSIGATCLMGVWVPFQASFLGLLLARDQGALLVAAVVALAVTTDIAAFSFGSMFGRRRLAPSVSPSKTWEGLAGGLLTAVVVAAAATAPLVEAVDVLAAVALGVVVALAATLGDLSESLVKRDLGLKDLGRIIPGHGGIMDRVDGLLFALPAAHLLLLALGL